MSGTIAEIELVFGDGLNDFFKRKLIKIPLPFGWAACRDGKTKMGRQRKTMFARSGGGSSLSCRFWPQKRAFKRNCMARGRIKVLLINLITLVRPQFRVVRIALTTSRFSGVASTASTTSLFSVTVTRPLPESTSTFRSMA